MTPKIENLIVEFRELMIIRRGLPPSDSRKKVKDRLKEISKTLVNDHWDEMPQNIKDRLGLKPKNFTLTTPRDERTTNK
jgi:hypothetical protein